MSSEAPATERSGDRVGGPLARAWGRLSSLASALRERGVLEAVRFAGFRLHEEFREWRLGIRTTGYVTSEELRHENREYHEYSPVPYRALDRCLGRLSLRPGVDVFLDMGAGLGRAAILAGTHPFARVIAVEINPELAEACRRNVQRARGLRCEVRVEAADAVAYEIPADVSVVHIYNAFEGRALERVVEKLRESVTRFPRRLQVIYGNPGTFERIVAGQGWIEKVWAGEFYPATGYAVFRHPPGDRR